MKTALFSYIFLILTCCLIVYAYDSKLAYSTLYDGGNRVLYFYLGPSLYFM